MTDFIMRVLTATAMAPHDLCGEIFWRVDGKNAPITFFLDCSDTFSWGTADFEPLTEENIHIFEEAVADICAVNPDYAYYAPELFAARIRGRRPMAFAYPSDPKLHALFDACGPAR